MNIKAYYGEISKFQNIRKKKLRKCYSRKCYKQRAGNQNGFKATVETTRQLSQCFQVSGKKCSQAINFIPSYTTNVRGNKNMFRHVRYQKRKPEI